MKTLDLDPSVRSFGQPLPVVSPQSLYAALVGAAGKVAPLWPLGSSFAVDPFVGLAEASFTQTARILGRAMGARLTMPRGFYAQALRAGLLGAEDLAAAAEDAPAGLQLDGERLRALAEQRSIERPTAVPTVAELTAQHTSTDWASLVVQRIGAWAEAHYDQGQAIWSAPGAGRRPYEAWRAEASHDEAPALMGLPGFRDRVRALPVSPLDAALAAVDSLELTPAQLDAYLHRLLMTIGGWASFVRQRSWHRSQSHHDELVELLVIRLVWDAILYEAFQSPALRRAWALRREQLASPAQLPPDLEVDLVLQRAYERSAQRRLIRRFGPRRQQRRPARRPLVQATFCADVRSERLRRALERQSPAIETLGVAGFFEGPMALRVRDATRSATHGSAQADPSFGAEHVDGQSQRARAWHGRAWSWIERAAVSSFGFAEIMGLGYGLRLLAGGLGWTRTAAGADTVGFGRATTQQQRSDSSACSMSEGLDVAARVELAASLLGSMSLRDGFARVVLLCGHEAPIANGPRAHQPYCGMCNGKSGAASASMAVELLNDPAVREGLGARGIVLPADTLFVPAVHDIATDEVRLLGPGEVPYEHAFDLTRLRRWLTAASEDARAEQAQSPGTNAGRLAAKSRDRSESGVAGCTSFIVAPRHRTASVDLRGRAFLHSYRWRDDEGFAVLESILTEPVVAASWANLQYYASSVDNEHFGSGNAALHDVVGRCAVVEGSGGDIRAGLPLQSVHDGERWVHEPARLSVVIEAPQAAIEGVLERHRGLRALADHGWLYLWAMDDDGIIQTHYAGHGRWSDADVIAGTARGRMDQRIAS